MNTYPDGFEENHGSRSEFIRELTLHLLTQQDSRTPDREPETNFVPRKLVQYWHDHERIPDDVKHCLASWDCLVSQGFEVYRFSDQSAATYISDRYGKRERQAFARCWHPAMRSDYLRLCFIFADGGMYVDADDVLVGDGWQEFFRNGRLKLQPLCYDIPSAAMVPNMRIWQSDLPTQGRIFYLNNNPIVATEGHPVLGAALKRATDRLLAGEPRPEIQETTGPGNLTAALAAHARNLFAVGNPLDFEILRDWEAVAETCWDLTYRRDDRNWRNVKAKGRPGR